MQFILGLIIMGIGFLFISKTESLLSNFGRIDFFERYLGVEGGSRLGYKLIGILLIFIGFLLFTGMFEGFMEWVFSPLTRHM